MKFAENRPVKIVMLGAGGTGGHTAEARSHMEWHIASMFGELMPDCGIYFLREGRSYMTEDEHKKILCNMKDYAICVVKLIWEKPNHED